MFYTKGYNYCLKNIALLAKKFQKEIKNEQDIKNGYIQFLKKYHPILPKPTTNELQFVRDNETIEELTKYFLPNNRMSEKDLVEISRIDTKFTEKELDTATSITRKSLEFINNIDSDLYQMIKLYINHIFFRKSETSSGGSTSGAIGVIWCSGVLEWNEIEMAEFLIHEFTHNTVFVDELINKYFTTYEKIISEENWAKSAILHRKRPLDKVVHSIIVAHNVISFREKIPANLRSTKVHPDTKIIKKQIDDALQSTYQVQNNTNILTDTLLDHLNICQKANSNVSYIC